MFKYFIVSPLQKYLNIQLYNDHFFKTNSPSILQPSIDRPSNPIDEGYFKSHTPHANQLPTIKQLYHATNASAFHIEEIPFSPAVLTHLQIQESKHKLLFIKFAPVSTIRPFWCLVQVDLDITLDLYPDTPPNNMHYYVFLAKHPNDIHKSYWFVRWWLEWYNYSRYKDTNDIIYGRRILIRTKKILIAPDIFNGHTKCP